MEHRKLHGLFLACCALFALWSCQPKHTKFNQDNYLAHIMLDSSILIITEVAVDLEVPWDLDTTAPGWVWFTQQKGTVSRLNTQTGVLEDVLEIDDVFYRKSTGLLSMALHSDFENNPYVYVHYTHSEKDKELVDQIFSKVVRYSFKENKLINPITILDSIPGNTYHNGSRMMIHSDGKLWLGTGDAGKTDQTQNKNTYHGKVLRMHLDGSVPNDNPFAGSLIWSMGYRNIQGITFGHNRIYASDHGPNNDDEVNLVTVGGNYGWPDVEGYCDLEAEKVYCSEAMVIEPLRAWTPTIAVSGLEFYESNSIPEWSNSLLLANLKGQALRILHLNKSGEHIEKESTYLYKEFGRIRDVAVGATGEIYLTTSNLDWHPIHQPWMYEVLPTAKGDRILKIEVANSAMIKQLSELKNARELGENKMAIELPSENFDINASPDVLQIGKQLYARHCASCHGLHGRGNIGQIPPLFESDWVSSNVSRLIDVTLQGLSNPITVNGIVYEGEMPGFKNLQDDEIAAILNYIRTQFNSAKGNIVGADVHHQRKGLK